MKREGYRVECMAPSLTDRTPLCLVASYTLHTQPRQREWRWRVAVATFSVAWTISLVAVVILQTAGSGQSNTPGGLTTTDLSTMPPIDAACRHNSSSRVVVIRHCDKDSKSRRHCSARGFQRAKWLPSLFVGDQQRWPVPAWLIARAPEPKHYVQRSVETLEPLSAIIGVPIVQNYSATSVDALIDHVLYLVRSGKLCGKLALVCWKHEQIPRIVEALGYHPLGGHRNKLGRWSWKGKDYDTAVDINFTLSDDTWHVSGRLVEEGF